MQLVLSNSQGVGAGINIQPAYLSSAAHLEPVFMYKGEVCTGKFVFVRAKRYVKVRCVCMQLITAERINRVVDYLMRFHHQGNLISGGL